MTRKRATLVVLVASLAFAFASPVARSARPADPLFVAFGRLAVAAVALSLISLSSVVTSLRTLPKKKLALIGLAGALLAAHFALFLIGLDQTSLPAAVSLVSLEPLSVVLAAWAFFKIRPSSGERVGLALATAGALVVAQGAGSGDHRLVGDLLVVGAVALFGLYLAVARGLKDALPANAYAALVYTVAATCLAIVAAATGRFTWSGLEGHSWIAILVLGLVPTVLGHTLVQTASRTLSPAIVAMVCPGETLGGILVGVVWLGQKPSALEALGAALILLGASSAILSPAPPKVLAGDRSEA